MGRGSAYRLLYGKRVVDFLVMLT